ncbi:MAG: preprotein translocase subunit SecE [FCB group bacterium]|nr:preprotein translocase subunit SecE [FCB group bacterium]
MVKKTVNYLKDVRLEMSKVSWPSRDELIESTIIVMIVSGILALYLFAIDSGLNRIVQFIL